MQSGPCALDGFNLFSWSNTPLIEISNLWISPYGLSPSFGSGILPSAVYTLLNCSFNASAFNESSLTIDPPTCKSPMPWLSFLSFEMKVQNDFGLSVMLVVRNWLIWDTMEARRSLCTLFLMSQNSCQSSWFLVFFALLYNRCFLLYNFFKFFCEPGKVVPLWSKVIPDTFIYYVCDFGGYTVPSVINGHVIV